MIPSALQAAPRLVGLPDSVVEIEHLGDRSARLLLTPAPSRTLRARAARLWAALRAPSALTDELAFQQQQLGATRETLRQTEGGFRAALDALPAFVVLHADHRIIYANPATCAALGREVLDRPLDTLVAPEDRERLAEVLAGAPGTLPLQFVRHDTTPIHVEVGVLPAFEFGRRRARGLFAIDVSRRVKSEATTHLLLQALPDLLIRASADGTLLDVHAGTALTIHARVLRTLIGRQGSELATRAPGVLGEHIRSCRAAFDTALERGEEQRLEIEGVLDRVRRYEVRIVPQEHRREALILVRDVTAQRETERKLAAAERMASVGTLAAGVAHEINNPLTYVLVGLDELAEHLAALAASGIEVGLLHQRLAEVVEGADRVREIVAALRMYSRVDTRATRDRVVPATVVDRALAMCGNQLRQGARVVQRLASAPVVLGDATQLIQVVVNLLLNASQALAGGARADARIEISVDTDARGWAVIAVEDNGPGIPEEHQPHVFDPFFTTKPRGQGTGLGLSVSHQIVSDHGGELRFETEPGRGSRFLIVLPPAPGRAEPAHPHDAATGDAATTGVGLRILVIDDEPQVARTFVRALQSCGYVAQALTSPHEALALLETTSFDLIICDLMMPGLGGMELYPRIAARDPRLAERFVFATGGAFSDEARLFVEQTPSPVLDKPFTVESLRQTVATALRRLGHPIR